MNSEKRNREKKKSKRKEFLEFFADAGDFEDEESERKERLEELRRKRQAREQEDSFALPKARRRPQDRQIDYTAHLEEERRRKEERRQQKRQSRKEHSKSRGHVFAVVFLLMLIIAAVAGGAYYYKKYSYSSERMDLAQYFNISGAEDAAVIIGNEVSQMRALQRNGYLYLPLSFVKENLNSRFYYDRGEGQLMYALPDKVLRYPENSNTYYENDTAMNNPTPVWVMSNSEPYLEVGFLGSFANFVAERYEEPLRLQLYLEPLSTQSAAISGKTKIRYQGGVKSPILKDLEEGERVSILEELEQWDKVKSADGIIGYVEKKFLSAPEEQQIQIPQNYQEPVYTSLTRDHRINMAWHQVTSLAANDTVYDLLSNTKNLNVISPTWYFLSDNAGDFTTIASEAYVADMHQRGIEVWALIDNFTNEVDISQILGSYTNRQNLIGQLIPSVLSYGIDGINVDFEQVPAEAGEDYVEFIRELSIACRANNLVLSVDNYVPTASSDFYNRREQGIVADYVVIMGYDEHYSGSGEAGSVASLGYVLSGIEKTIQEVPAHKVINGIPFYTRLWRTSSGEVKSEALTMSMAQQALDKRGITPEWDDTTSQYYATFEEEGAICQIWLEEATSIRAKLTVMSQYDLGGVAAWKLGQENPAVWDEIAAYMNGSLTTGS